MKNILIPIFYTNSIENCLAYADYINSSIQANLFVVYVYQHPPQYAWLSGDSYEAVSRLHDKEIEKQAKELSSRLEHLDYVHFDCVCTQRYFVDEILKIIEQQAIDLIIVSKLEMDLLEKESDAGLRETTKKGLYPILVIPDKAIFSPIRNFIMMADLAYDFNEEILKPCILLANACNAYMHILHIQSIEDEKKKLVEERISGQLADLYGNYRFVNFTNSVQNMLRLTNQQPYLIITRSQKDRSAMSAFEYTASMSTQKTLYEQAPLLLLN